MVVTGESRHRTRLIGRLALFLKDRVRNTLRSFGGPDKPCLMQTLADHWPVAAPFVQQRVAGPEDIDEFQSREQFALCRLGDGYRLGAFH